MNYARTGDTLLHLRSSYIQCSPRKRTSTAKLLALRNIQSLHIETVWDEKKKTLNIFTLGLHTVHIELPYCYLLGLQVVHICRGSIAWYPLLLPLDHTWSPNSFSQKIWIYVHLYKCKILSVRWNHWDCLALSLTHKLNPFFEVLLWMSKRPIQNLFVLFLLLMLILREA